MVAVIAVLACMPLKAAYAYIDPNSAGALYQFLFPLLIAIGSAFAFLRRVIVRACTKFAHAVVSDRARRPRQGSAGEAALERHMPNDLGPGTSPPCPPGGPRNRAAADLRQPLRVSISTISAPSTCCRSMPPRGSFSRPSRYPSGSPLTAGLLGLEALRRPPGPALAARCPRAPVRTDRRHYRRDPDSSACGPGSERSAAICPCRRMRRSRSPSLAGVLAAVTAGRAGRPCGPLTPVAVALHAAGLLSLVSLPVFGWPHGGVGGGRLRPAAPAASASPPYPARHGSDADLGHRCRAAPAVPTSFS